jgi:uncharacterized membrane protein
MMHSSGRAKVSLLDDLRITTAVALSAALFVLVRKLTADKVLEGLKGES